MSTIRRSGAVLYAKDAQHLQRAAAAPPSSSCSRSPAVPEANATPFREAAGRAPAKARKSGARVDYEAVREVALALPDVKDSSTLRGVAFKACGRLLACKAVNRCAEPDTLMVRMPGAERDRLIAEDPRRFYITPHYLPHDVVLVRLKAVGRRQLKTVLGLAWQFVTASRPRAGGKAPKRRKVPSVFRYL
jgi:hypothetical protein